jgi:hypothetical protein
MRKELLVALSEFMRDHSVSVSELKELSDYAQFYNAIPLIEDGEELPVELRYSDGKVSNIFEPMKEIKAIHLEGDDIDLKDVCVPMSYQLAVINCQQSGKRMMSERDARKIYQNFRYVNSVLELLHEEPLKLYRYWLSDKASKPYLAKVIDFNTGVIKEVPKREAYWIRPCLIF